MDILLSFIWWFPQSPTFMFLFLKGKKKSCNFLRAKERAEHAQRMAVAKPFISSKKRHKVALHSSQPPTKKGRRSVPSSKHVPVEKAFEQPSGQPKKIEFKLTEAISSIFDAGASNEMEG